MSVGKKSLARDGPVADGLRHDGGRGDTFPETQTKILADAAAGDWGPFLDHYLRPLWREVILACRAHSLPLTDADDLYQELMLRLMRDGRFRREVRSLFGQGGAAEGFRGNLVSRFLKYRELPLLSARFRTFLKGVVRNLVYEAVRKARRRPRQLTDSRWEVLEPSLEESWASSLDRTWVSDCLATAAWRLRMECQSARTRGQKRLFDLLYLSTVKDQSPGKIAADYGVDRTTVAALLAAARKRFAILLGQLTGIDSAAELKKLLEGRTKDLTEALAVAHSSRLESAENRVEFPQEPDLGHRGSRGAGQRRQSSARGVKP